MSDIENIKIQLNKIFENSKAYRDMTGVWPVSIGKLIEHLTIPLNMGIINKCNIEILLTGTKEGVGGEISSTSLKNMEDGEGHTVTFDAKTEEYTTTTLE